MSEWAVTDDLKLNVSISPKPPTSTIPAVRACNQASVVMTTSGYVIHSVGRNNAGLELVIASV